jgi:hypothetical protein
VSAKLAGRGRVGRGGGIVEAVAEEVEDAVLDAHDSAKRHQPGRDRWTGELRRAPTTHGGGPY